MTSAKLVAVVLEAARRRAAFLLDGEAVPSEAESEVTAITEALAQRSELRLPTLQRTFELSLFETRLIVYLLAADCDPSFRITMRSQRDIGRPCLGAGTLVELLALPSDEIATLEHALSPRAPLRCWALVEGDEMNEGTPFMTQKFRLDPRVTGYLLDEDDLPEGMVLHLVATPVPEGEVAAQLVERLERATREAEATVVELVGRSISECQAYARRTSRALGRSLVAFDVLAAPPGRLSAQLAALRREARLGAAIPALVNWHAIGALPSARPAESDVAVAPDQRKIPATFLRFIAEHDGILFLVGEEHEPTLSRLVSAVCTVEVPSVGRPDRSPAQPCVEGAHRSTAVHLRSGEHAWFMI